MSGDHRDRSTRPCPADTVAAEPTRAKLETKQRVSRPLRPAPGSACAASRGRGPRGLRGALVRDRAAVARSPLQVLGRPAEAKRGIGARHWPSVRHRKGGA